MTTKEARYLMDVGGCLLSLLLLPLIWVVEAWALVKLWSWFVTPFFHVPAPGYATALGLAMLIGAVTKQEDYRKNKDEEYAWGVAMVTPFVKYPLLVGFGWIIKHWV